MNIEELVAGLKEKGLTEDQVREELERIKADIDAILLPKEKIDEVKDEVKDDKKESEEEKQKRIFGI